MRPLTLARLAIAALLPLVGVPALRAQGAESGGITLRVPDSIGVFLQAMSVMEIASELADDKPKAKR